MDSAPLLRTEAFGASPARTPVIVIKRRRRAELATAPGPVPGEGSESRPPRVFVLPAPAGAPDPADEAQAPPATAEPAPLRTARRKPRRDPLRMPGAVVHTVCAVPEPEPADDGLGFHLNEDDYPKVMAAIQAVQRLLDEAAAAARFRLELPALT